MITFDLGFGDYSVSNDRMSPVGVQIEIGAIHVPARQDNNTASISCSQLCCLECGEWVYIISYYIIRILAPK